MIYFYFGEDDLGLKRQVSTIIQSFSNKYGVENVSQININESNTEDVLSEIINVGLFSESRLVILREVFENKFFCEKLTEILPRIPKETEVVIIEPKPDKRTKLYKVLSKEYKTKEFVMDKNIAKFVMDEANTKKVEINREGIEELINYTGGDRWKIASELEKFANLNKLVTPKLIHEHVEPDLQANVFNILDDLLSGKREKVLQEIAKLRIQEDANRFFALLASQVFALSVAINASQKTSSEAAREAGVHPFVMSKMFDYARRTTKKDIEKISRIISETDEKLKTTKTDSWTLIELAISQF